MIPDWQLPPGVDRGLWDYLHSAEMVAEYDEQMRQSPLAAADVAFCEQAFPTPGRLIDLGCGTGRLCLHFAGKGYDCVGVDLSEEMLAKAREKWTSSTHAGAGAAMFMKANLLDLSELPAHSFDYAACLFSTLGMVRGEQERSIVIANAHRLLKPDGLLVLHVHNRFFRGLGWGRIVGQAAKSLVGQGGDITMPQAYGGAALTLHHFARREAVRLLEANGFQVRNVLALGSDGKPAWPLWRVYGWLALCEKMA
jgi:ubiquinone/menaquinone biosynthesis C-methylase UbiE